MYILLGSHPDQVYRATNGGVPGADWPMVFQPTVTCASSSCPSATQCPYHLHGLGIFASDGTLPNTVLYVGTGHGNWGDDLDASKVWKSPDGGNTWSDVTGTTSVTPNCSNPPLGMFPPPDSTQCNANTEAGCFSLYDIAVSAKLYNNNNVVYVGTFGHENNPGKVDYGKGIGVVRSTAGGGNTWATITQGLCSNGVTTDCSTCTPTPCNPPCPTAGSLSLFVGKVAITNFPSASITQDYVFIATMNGIYYM